MGTWAAAVQQGDEGASWEAHRMMDADSAGQLGGTLGPPQTQQVRAGLQEHELNQRLWTPAGHSHASAGVTPARGGSKIRQCKPCVKLLHCIVWRCASHLRHEIAQGRYVTSLTLGGRPWPWAASWSQ